MRRLFVFDWDGTLMDSVGRIVSCLRQAADEQGLADLGDAAFGDVIGLGLPQQQKQSAAPVRERRKLCRLD